MLSLGVSVHRPLRGLPRGSLGPLLQIAIVTLLGSVAGCADLTRAILDRPVEADEIAFGASSSGTSAPTVATVATAATRRLVVFNEASAATVSTSSTGINAQTTSNNAQSGMRVLVCAEPPPDAGLNALSQSTLELAGAIRKSNLNSKAVLEQSYQSIIVALSTRTDVVEIYRTAAWGLCQLHMNGAPDSVINAFTAITKEALKKAENVVAPGSNQQSGSFSRSNGREEAEGADKDDDAAASDESKSDVSEQEQGRSADVS